MKSNFDDIIKKRWEEKQFPVDESHRVEMLELLNQQKRRRVFPFWWLGGMIVIVAMSGYFLLNIRETPIDPHQPKTESSQTTEEYASNSKTTSAEKLDPKNIGTEGPSVGNSELRSQTSNTTLNTNTTSNKISPNKQGKKTNTSNHNQTAFDQNSNPSGTPPAQSTPNHYLVDEEATHSYVISSVPVAVRVFNSEEELAAYKASTQQFSEKTGPIGTLPISDIDYSAETSIDLIKPLNSGRSSLYFFGEVGTGLILASEPYFSSGWKLRAGGGGIAYRPSLSKFDFNLSAGYLFQNGGFDYERTSTFNQLGFGVRSSFNTLKPDKLHFIYSKLGAQYHLRRHLFAAHGGIQWLYGSQGDISVVTQVQVPPVVEVTSQYAWLKTDGLQKVHWTADVCYGYQITPRLSAVVGTDIYFSSFTVEDPALEAEGYYWDGKFSRFQPFITLNYLIYGLQ